MILQSLNKLYDRLAADPAYLIPQPGYSTQKVAFAVVLKRGGELLRIEDIRQLQGRRRIPRTMFLPGQTKPSGSGTNPGLLWDNSSYLMAHVPPRNGDESKQHYAKRRRRAALCFNSFRTRHLSLERTIDDDHFSMVCRFLEAWSPPRAGRHPLLDELIGGFGLFRIAGESGFVHERPAIQNYWQAQTTPDASPAEDDICLVTGRPGVAARTHQPRLKGISGAQSTGATLVSFNCSAFGSYGRD